MPILHERVEAGSPPVVILPWLDSTQLLHKTTPKPLPIDQVATFLRRASDALSMLHDRGVIYGILTPDNVYVEERLQILRFPAISIFGFLSHEQPWNKVLAHKLDAGTYLIPEQYYGQSMSPRSDQYALGQLALQMLCGAAPVTVTCPADLEKKRQFFECPAEFVRRRFEQASWPDEKLRGAMIGMLNFREGAEPTTLYEYVPVHLERGVTTEELDQFEKSLMRSLEHQYGVGSKKVAAGVEAAGEVLKLLEIRDGMHPSV